MTELPFLPGQFVWCRFPYNEAPLSPGDKERIVYVADIRRLAGRNLLTTMSLYTTTSPWDAESPLPLGLIPIAAAEAAKMNQKAFIIDARRIAFVPVNDAFFPRLQSSDRIVHTASKSFRREVENVIATLVKRPDLVQLLGPHAPNRKS